MLLIARHLELSAFITSPDSPIIGLFLNTGYLGWFCNQRTQLYNVSWMSNFQYSSAYSQSHFGPRLQRLERVIILAVKSWKHVENSSKCEAVCSKKLDRKKQMAQELFWNSSKDKNSAAICSFDKILTRKSWKITDQLSHLNFIFLHFFFVHFYLFRSEFCQCSGADDIKITHKDSNQISAYISIQLIIEI